MHEIDLSNYDIRTDLIDEVIEKDKFDFKIKDNIKINRVKLKKEDAIKINKKTGYYVTISFDDITDFNNLEEVKEIFSNELKKVIDINKIKEKNKALIVGLGNIKSTPDSLGPKVVDNIIVTNHIFEINELDKKFRSVSAFIPGVKGNTGIESSELILSVIKTISPDFIIAIDALASQSLERLNKTIQITDTGITPGSGIGNSRKEISKDTVGIPVIAIGVPTVVGASTIVADTIEYIYRSFEFAKKPISKLNTGNLNYLKYKSEENNENKKNLLGLVGALSETELKKLVNEVLTPIGYNLVVSPKEIDFLIDKLADLIGNGINRAINKDINNI